MRIFSKASLPGLDKPWGAGLSTRFYDVQVADATLAWVAPTLPRGRPGNLLRPRTLNPGAASGHNSPKRPNLSAIPDAAMMIVT